MSVVWRSWLLLISGLMAAGLIGSLAFRFVVGLSSPPPPGPLREYVIPHFAELVTCDAHFSAEILRLKKHADGERPPAGLREMHRNYRRLHRLMRQVGRRDGIDGAVQTEQLRRQVVQFSQSGDARARRARDMRCREMAELPIARKRTSEIIVGRGHAGSPARE